MYKLKITNCKNHIEEITLTEGIHNIGRSLDSTLRLEGEEVSRLHARLFVKPNLCELVDEGSKNGTFINGNRITSNFLNDGDIIKIGRFNLQFTSDIAEHHKEKRRIKIPFLKISLVSVFIIFSGLFLYQKSTGQKTKIILAERTAQYLAERNKEALYLGEYDSINLTNLPPEIEQVAIWDRHGNLRATQPPGIDSIDVQVDVRGDASHIRKIGNTVEIYTPIYYESVHVGTLWMVYKL